MAHDRGIGVADEGMHLAVLGHTQGESALAPAVTDDQGSHGPESRQRTTPADGRGRCAARPSRTAALSHSPASVRV